MFFGIAVGFAGLFFWVGKLWSLVVIPCVLSWDTVFPFLDWVLLKEFQGFSFFVFWFVVAGLAIPARSRHFEAGAWWWFSVWEFVFFLCVGICLVSLARICRWSLPCDFLMFFFLKHWHFRMGTCRVLMLVLKAFF